MGKVGIGKFAIPWHLIGAGPWLLNFTLWKAHYSSLSIFFHNLHRRGLIQLHHLFNFFSNNFRSSKLDLMRFIYQSKNGNQFSCFRWYLFTYVWEPLRHDARNVSVTFLLHWKLKDIEGVYCIPAWSVRSKYESRKCQLAERHTFDLVPCFLHKPPNAPSPYCDVWN